MKKVFKIMLTAMLAAVCAISFLACAPNDDNGTGGDTGLLIKKIDGVYTVYDYVAEEGVTELDIGKVLSDKQITEDIRIKKGAFDGNDSLTKIVVPAAVKEIDSGAFRNMQKLKTLEVPFIGKTINSDGFENESATAANKSVDAERTIAHFFGTSEYDAGRAITINYGASTVTCYVPVTFDTVIVNAARAAEGKNYYSIPMHAFDGATNIKSVTLKGEKLGAIGVSAFNGCVALKTVILANDLSVAVKENAFKGCNKLSYFGINADTLPEKTISFANVTAVEENAFDLGNENVYTVVDADNLDITAALGETKTA